MPTIAASRRLPFCDRCSELATTHAAVQSEVALDRWWKWLSYPRFSCQPEAMMGCEKHPVQSEVRFLDGRVEPFRNLCARKHTITWMRFNLPHWSGDALLGQYKLN